MQRRFGLSVNSNLRCLRLELKPGPFRLRRENEGRSRITVLGLAVRKAWDDLPGEFPGLMVFDLGIHARMLEGVIGFPPASAKTAMTEVVRRFKGLCQNRFALLRDEPGDLWAPGFIEGPLREHFGPSSPAD